VLVGNQLELGRSYYLGIGIGAGLFVYQQYLIRGREAGACFKAFLNNNWVGAVILLGLVADLSV
jgi:4-hydroxybenzoate polyprenyltransferase